MAFSGHLAIFASKAPPRRLQDASKTPPSSAKTPPRRRQDAPRRFQDAPRGPQYASMTPPRRPERPQDAPQCLHDAQRRPQDAPKTLQDVPSTLPGRSQDAPNVHFYGIPEDFRSNTITSYTSCGIKFVLGPGAEGCRRHLDPHRALAAQLRVRLAECISL